VIKLASLKFGITEKKIDRAQKLLYTLHLTKTKGKKEEGLCSRDGLRKPGSIAGPHSNTSFSMVGLYVLLRDIPNEQTR
jgi:hypothetical protein